MSLMEWCIAQAWFSMATDFCFLIVVYCAYTKNGYPHFFFFKTNNHFLIQGYHFMHLLKISGNSAETSSAAERDNGLGFLVDNGLLFRIERNVLSLLCKKWFLKCWRNHLNWGHDGRQWFPLKYKILRTLTKYDKSISRTILNSILLIVYQKAKTIRR